MYRAFGTKRRRPASEVKMSTEAPSLSPSSKSKLKPVKFVEGNINECDWLLDCMDSTNHQHVHLLFSRLKKKLSQCSF